MRFFGVLFNRVARLRLRAVLHLRRPHLPVRFSLPYLSLIMTSESVPGVVLPKSIPIFGNVPNGTSHISSTIGVQLENSSDLSLGRRPDSKSDEFSSCTPMVDEIFMFLRLKPLKSCYTVWEHDQSLLVVERELHYWPSTV